MSLIGLDVCEMPDVPDDTCWMISGRIYVGTKAPADPVVLAGREARLRVRAGLADVLQWLGKPVVNEPLIVALKSGFYAPGARR